MSKSGMILPFIGRLCFGYTWPIINLKVANNQCLGGQLLMPGKNFITRVRGM